MVPFEEILEVFMIGTSQTQLACMYMLLIKDYN